MSAIARQRSAPLPTLAQVAVSIPVATAAVRASLAHDGIRDETLLLKTAMTEAFGGALLRPWRLVGLTHGTATLLGYSDLDEDALRTRLAYATPGLQQAVQVVGASAMPAIMTGQSLRFRVRLCPTVRQTGKGEIDAMLYAVRNGPDARHNRADVYSGYLIARMRGAEVQSLQMDGFRLARMMRREATKGWSARTFPVAEMSGVLTVVDPELLAVTITTGVGRQRAFGCGFIRVEPV